MKITVVGAGAWGTALALVLHENGHSLTLWGHDPGHLEAMARFHENRIYLPGIALPETWSYFNELTDAVQNAELLLLAVPSHAFRTIAGQLPPSSTPILSVTKGIEYASGLTMSGILNEILPGTPIAALSGPTLALEVARNVPTAVVVAATHAPLAEKIRLLFHRPTFRIYTSSDLLGVELGGALKNVYAIAAGVCDGLGFGDNSKAALITRSALEMRQLGVRCGAFAETFSGLSGLGDLTVTCFSKLSRNRTFGERLGRGERIDAILASTQAAVEGLPTAKSAWKLAQEFQLDLPILESVHGMLHEGRAVRQVVTDLLQRDSKAELPEQ